MYVCGAWGGPCILDETIIPSRAIKALPVRTATPRACFDGAHVSAHAPLVARLPIEPSTGATTDRSMMGWMDARARDG